MSRDNGLIVQAGFATRQGRRADNQDYIGLVCPAAGMTAHAEVLAVVADGCGGLPGGRTAAEVCVRGFLEGFVGLPQTLGAHRRASRALSAVNGWIHAMGRQDPGHRGMATTFSALVLDRRRAHTVHIGDSRIYRLRGERLDRLTRDHALTAPGLAHVLTRAVGFDSAVPADCEVHPMEAHDRYVLCTDGLHGALSTEAIGAELRRRQHPQACADSLADAALQKDGSDNITVAVVDVIALPPPGSDGLYESLGELAVLELPEVGHTVDDYVLEHVLSKGRYSCLFVANDRRTGSGVVLKFPHPRVVSEREYLEAFTREAWIGLRIKSPWLAEIIEQAPGRQTRLYSVMPHYRGDTLESRLVAQPPVSFDAGLDVTLKLCRAVHALHRRGVIHRDIKPENVLLLEDGGLKLLDLGVASLPERGDLPEAPMPGTASYLAPELFREARASVVTDVFAVGVTLYRLFAGGHYPYGEIEPFTHPRFVGFRPLEKHRPDLPAWLGAVIQRAVAPDPKDRYADTIELAFDLEHGLAKGGQRAPAPRPPWFRRHPARAWQIAAIAQFLFLLFWFGFRSLPG